MSLLGIDVGTTGCKAAVFNDAGAMLAFAYREYGVRSPEPGQAELDAAAVWTLIEDTLREVAAAAREAAPGDPVRALSVSSLGEAFVPVSRDRRILAPSILNFDPRGQEFLPRLAEAFDSETLYQLTGNTLGNHYGLTKLMWLRAHEPTLYEQADYFLPWTAFVSFMLGGDPVVDYAQANRALLFDLGRAAWSTEITRVAGIDPDRLPPVAPTGTVIGTVDRATADRLGLPAGVKIVTGAHDQCINGVGCGVIDEGPAMCGMGTYICIMPVFSKRPTVAAMIGRGLNTEHHAVPGRYVSFLYNQGGALLKWYRDTFAATEHQAAREAGRDVYPELLAEMPAGPSGVIVLPHFMATGSPEFISDSCGLLAGLHVNTSRGRILKGIRESVIFYFREVIETLPGTGIRIDEFRAVGGGSKSDAWLQLAADIMDRPFVRLKATEAGVLGAALVAGTAVGIYASPAEAVARAVAIDRVFEPDPASHERYQPPFEQYKKTWPLMSRYLRELAAL